MLKKGVTLRGIEVFEALAQAGSVAQAAVATGLSQPAVSQQMRNLEQAVGADLIDHSRRPMRLTPAGELFLRHAGLALSELRQAQSEVTVMDLAHLEDLNLGIIDDFDNDLTPRLATILADSLTGCRFRMITDGSLALARAIEARELHIAIGARPDTPPEGVTEYPLARDPLIIVAPAGQDRTPEDLLAGSGALPLLHYAAEQLIAQQIDQHLAQAGLSLPTRFEIGSHLALMAMVARGIGWAITTPLGYMRAARFHDALQPMPLPLPDAARQITLFAGADWSDPVPRDIAGTMRRLMQTHMIAPATAQQPWLADGFHLIEDQTP
ncbi:HTH-type transcriptional regulator CynR [Sulfitobacter sp. THAF37]|uniref:LysR family transcriptional regulator n=1 Tax=Sulfitobacter sp. THAF37 TaxID=2587855 RepID=UPI001268892B|nr:LysR family transcriptional regulator [Sulfitobacter sp. THAF37]QFT57683.1 HTH-type transcriptional regulator CynR [Sulfitobacter sp. THAF37]